LSRIKNRRTNLERVMHALQEARQDDPHRADPIVEQLKQCPEAFKVGEILGKAFDSLKYAQNDGATAERYLPPSGAIIPPLV
jgi:hypothetical protein